MTFGRTRVGGWRRRVRWGALAAVLALVAAACSGGGDDASPAPTATSPGPSTAEPAPSPPTGGDPAAVSDLMAPEVRKAVIDDLVDFINTEVVVDSAQADQQILSYLEQRPEFVDAGVGEDGTAWGLFSDGVLYAHMAPRPSVAAATPSTFAPAVPDTTVPSPAAAPATSGMRGTRASYRSASSGASLPDSTTALLISGLSDSYPDIPAAVRAGLTAKGYQVTRGGASVEDLKFPGRSGIGILYFSTHGGSAGLWTTTEYYGPGDDIYALELEQGLLGTGTAGVDANPDYNPEACRLDPHNARVCNERIEETHYIIRPKFIKTYWPGHFADGSFVVLDACNSVWIVPAAGIATGAPVVTGWSGTVSAEGGNRILTLFFDRLLGINQAPPDETPDLRPFDAARVAEYMKAVGENSDGATSLIVTHRPASLVPSIKVISIDESADEMVIEGMFGDEPGTVNFNGHHLEGEWQRGVIRVPITDDMAGPVYVEQRGRRSNEVLITEWRGKMSLIVDAGPLGKELTLTAEFDLHLRADIHMFRDKPQDAPLRREALIVAAGDSTSTWEASGTSTATGTRITASGSGIMEVEVEGMSHDNALFNLRMGLVIDAWDLPPTIEMASLHAHLSAEPNTEARLDFEVPDQHVEGGFAMAPPDSLAPLPFEFDDRFNILEGSKSGSGPGEFGLALSWNTFRASHAPDLTKPPPPA
ncbi:MAG: hypothetical protein ACE5E8_01645 [Acidimicrobiia bacterium]